jgi:uncharacterized caspase-like protein
MLSSWISSSWIYRCWRYLLAAVLLTACVFAAASKSFAQADEPRLALVIGNARYWSGALATPANDAGLVAQTLQTAGFDVTGAADLEQEPLRQAFREFIDKVKNAGPNAVVFIYLAGRGVQYAGENYFVPIDAVIQRDSEVPLEALRLADYSRALAGLSLKARIIVLDAARANTYAKSGAPLAGGLAIVDAEPGALYAFNAAPGTIAPDEQGPYNIYAQALVEMMQQGWSADEVFTQTRLRVNQLSGGSVVPWDVSKLDSPIFFFEREASAPPLQSEADPNQPLQDYPAPEAYAVALERDTIAAYQEFLAVYPREPIAIRVRALLAVRREALTWRRSVDANSSAAYWSYMRRYPHGPHFADARRRLVILAAPLDPPPRFDPYDFVDLAPPPEADYGIVDQPAVIFDNPDYPPPPPLPFSILPERPAQFVRLPPPSAHAPGFLPVPEPTPVPFSRPTGRVPGFINPPKFGQQKPPTDVPPARGHELPVPRQQQPVDQPLIEHVAPERELGAPPGPRPEPGLDHALPPAPRVEPEQERVVPPPPRAEPERIAPPQRAVPLPTPRPPPPPAPRPRRDERRP